MDSAVGGGDRQPDGTLAGASGLALDKFLQKRTRRQKDGGLPKASAEAAGVLPYPPQATAEGACGAPAGTAAEDDQPSTRAQGTSRVEEAAPAPADCPVRGRHSDDGHDSEEWEEAGDMQGFLNDALADSGDADLVISLGAGEQEEEGAAGKAKGRRRYTEAEVLCAALVHQSHLLCLLGRAQMHDLAASKPDVKAAALSLVPPEELQALERRGNYDKGALVASQLSSLVHWFQQSFQVEASKPYDEGKEARRCDGTDVISARLHAVAGGKKGSAEELVALFVSMLRASGQLVRYLRALDPLPWRPGAGERHVPKQKAPPAKRAAADRAHKKGQASGAYKRRRTKKEEAAEASAGDAEKDAGKAVKGAANAGKRKGGKGKLTSKPAESELENAELEEQRPAQPAKRPRRGKGDLEFENQLAMAMLASEAPKDESKEEDGAAEYDPKKAAKAAAKSAGGAPGLGSTWAREHDRNQAVDYWAEVYCDGEDGGQGRWVPVHPLQGWIDQPERMEAARVRFGSLAYVVALGGGGAKDVTSRYVSNMRLAEKARGPNARWWAQTLRPLRSPEAVVTRAHLADLARSSDKVQGRGTSAADAPNPTALHKTAAEKRLQKAAKQRASREDEELKRRLEQQQLEVPTTLEGFKNHKHYILQRHISRYTAIRPGAKPAGTHRGEAYFHTRDVSELHTAEKWVQLGWQVTDAQLGAPFKVVPRRGSKRKSAPADAYGMDEDGSVPTEQDPALLTKLYGKWQTDTWKPPVAQDGVVPKNERGTVHCPPLAAALPVGTMQIDRPRIGGVCKRLGVDYAPAMTGFDIRGGRSVPRIEGVVVCAEAADAVLQEWEREQSELAEKEARKRLEGAGQLWAALLKAIFTRLRLQDPQQASAQEPGKKAGKGAGRKNAPKQRAAAMAGGASGGKRAWAGKTGPNVAEEAVKATKTKEALEEGWLRSGGGAVAEYENI